MKRALEKPQFEKEQRKLLDFDRRVTELMIASSHKSLPVSIGGEDLTVTNLLNNRLSVADRAKKSLARTLARRLNSSHPDRNGELETFHLVREMVSSGDVDGLRVLCLKEGQTLTETEFDTLYNSIAVRFVRLQGSPLFKAVQYLYSGKHLAFETALKKLLRDRILELEGMLLGIKERMRHG